MKNVVLAAFTFGFLFLEVGAHGETQKLDPLFKEAPHELDPDLVVEVVDWGWLGAIMRRGRLRVRQNDFNRLASFLNASSKKGSVNRDIQGGIQGLSRNARGSAKGLLTAVQNLVILVDAGGKAYVWNTISGEPVAMPKNDRLFEQIEASIPSLPRVESGSETVEEYLNAFESAANPP